MKKVAFIFLILTCILSCSDDVQFNNPGFSGNKNYKLWKATYFNAVLSEGNLNLTAGKNSEVMTFRLASTDPGTYRLTSTSFSKADFLDFEDIAYSTSNPPDPSVSLYPEIGEVVITESTANYITGTFRFIAFTDDGLLSVGFNEGDFYRIPLN